MIYRVVTVVSVIEIHWGEKTALFSCWQRPKKEKKRGKKKKKTGAGGAEEAPKAPKA